MLRVRRLAESPLITVDRVDHPAHVPHVDPDEETSAQYSVNWLERGSFSIAYRSRRWAVGSTEIFLTAPGQIHRYIHDHGETAPTDSCIAIGFRQPAGDDVSRIDAVRNRVPVVRINNRHAYLKLRLVDHLAGDADSMALDLLAGEILDSIGVVEPRRLYRPAQLSWYAHRVERVRRMLDDDFASNHTLSSLARDAGMSAFHFARVFRELAGVPPHRYLLRRRMTAAADMLRDGAAVTETCFAVGFESLSHFVRAFQRTYAASPSQFRRGTRTPADRIAPRTGIPDRPA